MRLDFVKNNKANIVLGVFFLTFSLLFTKAITASSQADENAQKVIQIYRTCDSFCSDKGTEKYKIQNGECVCYSYQVQDKKRL